jgi:ankyrin repeat protein
VRKKWLVGVENGASRSSHDFFTSFVEEKVDEFLQQMPYQSEMQSSRRTSTDDQQSYCSLLREVAVFLTEQETQESSQPTLKKTKIEVSSEAERLLRDAAGLLSSTRPPNSFVVYNSDNEGPPIFDGSVANATPPSLGGSAAGASGGAGTILHLACALDVPLALAFLLAMGADARASHTAFRRLMIHEAACNGSIQCLTLLLELGRKFGDVDGNAATPSRDLHLPFLPRRIDRSQALAPIQLFATQPELFARVFDRRDRAPKMDFLSMLRLFRDLTAKVKEGTLSELDAARKIMEQATLMETSQTSLARSCGFHREGVSHRPVFRGPGGISDGHGNTPLHWAAFKNETRCVSLLLKYNADPNARAHPSGWTPLHDAAYSNSRETIKLLVDAGAEVDARANSGATPLCFAAQEDAADAADLLLERDADLSTRCAGGPIRDDGTPGSQSRFSGYTPLHYCAHYNAHKAAHVLLKHTQAADAMEIPDLSERLPVHVAVARGSSDVLRELLHAGVRIETRLRQQDGSLRRSRTPPRRRRPPTPESLPRAATPVSSPLLRSMIPAQPISSSKPWNCLTQRSIDDCRALISEAEQHWSPERHTLFTPQDRRAVAELLRVGKHLELRGTGIFLDLWPQVLSFCGRGWFEVGEEEDEGLTLPRF